MVGVSDNYREITLAELPGIAKQIGGAWKDDRIPVRQYELAVKSELEKYRHGEGVAPFDALACCLRRLPEEMNHHATRLLDAGASTGYYKKVLRLAGFDYGYTGIDFSQAFVDLGRYLFPGIHLDVADATTLPFPDRNFDIVLTGAVMMHVVDYEQVFAEAVRVASKYVVLHRTPVLSRKQTTFFVKEAYAVPCIEIHFNEGELYDMFRKYGVDVEVDQPLFPGEHFSHRSFLLRKYAVA